ncbi:MAG: hypothetical protein J5787_00770 [Alphaproteobacteria bacterium]|nr:hypothetical protein [Alphaproteobacteria bacterium]MBO4644639.1 hypothetical protein [Alphaproteobacteria bacterium]
MDCLIQLIFLLFFLAVAVLTIISRSDQGREFWRYIHEKYWHLELLLFPLIPGIVLFFVEDSSTRPYLLAMLAIILACEGIVLYGVHLYKKRKKKTEKTEPLSDPPRYHKNPYLCFAAALLFGYSLFFGDMYSTFDCRSDTQKCEYHSSTLINRKLRPTKTYDISEIIRTEVKRTSQKRRFYDNHPYGITFFSLDSSFSMPQKFSSFNDAANEAVKIDAVLTKKEASYHYEASRPTSETVFHVIITPVLFIYGLILYGRKKEREREKIGEGKKRTLFPKLSRRRKPHSSRKPPDKKNI